MDRGLPGLPIVLAVGGAMGVLAAALVAGAVALVPDDAVAPVRAVTVTESVPVPGPTVTVTRPVPGPTVTVTARPSSASRARTVTGWDAGRWDRFPSWVEVSARCVAKHESWHGDRKGRRLWLAQNDAGSSASGFAQWIDSSWEVQAERAGVGTQYPRAHLAPPHVQAAVFAHQATRHGLYPWAGTDCPGT
jgi:hypothetical protein